MSEDGVLAEYLPFFGGTDRLVGIIYKVHGKNTC